MKNEHPVIYTQEQDDIVNSLNYEGIGNWVAVLPLSWQWQTAVLALSTRLNGLND